MLEITEQVSKELGARGYRASFEYPGVIYVELPGWGDGGGMMTITFGTVNPTWGGDVDDSLTSGYVHTEVPSDCTDVARITDALVAAIVSCKPVRRYKEYEEIPIPDWLPDSSWQDSSWHNDACPHSTLFLTDDSDDAPVIEVWVNYEEASAREVPDRYMVVFQKYGSVESGTDVVLYHGEAEQDARRFARAGEIAKSMIAEIVGRQEWLRCRRLSELAAVCDINVLGQQEQFLTECGWTGGDDDKDAAALAKSLDVLNPAQHITDLWLQRRQ